MQAETSKCKVSDAGIIFVVARNCRKEGQLVEQGN